MLALVCWTYKSNDLSRVLRNFWHLSWPLLTSPDLKVFDWKFHRKIAGRYEFNAKRISNWKARYSKGIPPISSIRNVLWSFERTVWVFDQFKRSQRLSPTAFLSTDFLSTHFPVDNVNSLNFDSTKACRSKLRMRLIESQTPKRNVGRTLPKANELASSLNMFDKLAISLNWTSFDQFANLRTVRFVT